jgi:hypothetical protein
MTFAQPIGQLSIQEELSQRCAKFFEVARYVALEKTWLTGSHSDVYQFSGSESIQRVLKSAVASGTTTGWGQALTPYAQLADAFLLSLHGASAFDAMLPWMVKRT